jgi:hypothetical protein
VGRRSCGRAPTTCGRYASRPTSCPQRGSQSEPSWLSPCAWSPHPWRAHRRYRTHWAPPELPIRREPAPGVRPGAWPTLRGGRLRTRNHPAVALSTRATATAAPCATRCGCDACSSPRCARSCRRPRCAGTTCGLLRDHAHRDGRPPEAHPECLATRPSRPPWTATATFSPAWTMRWPPPSTRPPRPSPTTSRRSARPSSTATEGGVNVPGPHHINS